MAGQLDEVMTGFQRRLGLEPAGRAEDGGYALVFDGDFTIGFAERGPKAAVMSATLGDLPEGGRDGDATLDRLLNVNLARQCDHEDVLAADDAAGEFVLYRILALDDLSDRDFDEAVERFANAVAYWRARLDDRPAARPPLPPMMIFP